MSIYRSDPDAAPDTRFEPGTLRHLVVGGRGRLLDPRRTPVTIVDLCPATGFFVVRIDAFEDVGATWEVPFEDVGHYQFALGSRNAGDEALARIQDAVARLDRPLVIEPEPAGHEAAEARIRAATHEAAAWLQRHSRFLASGRPLPDPAARRGDALLAADLESYMRERGLWEVEDGFARHYVSNPHSGEVVKGHLIVIAELGLAPYVGKVVRDPATLQGHWSRTHRAGHVIARLAFVRALFGHLDQDRVLLWRGVSAVGPIDTGRRSTLVSASFSEDVARSHVVDVPDRPERLLIREQVPVGRLLMTYLETGAMNARYLEAEAVLLADVDAAAGLP